MEILDYKERREILKKKVEKGIILLAGNNPQPMNYPSNILPYRQDSTFLYYTGLTTPNLVFVSDCESGEEILFGYQPQIEDFIWSGPQTSLAETASSAGIRRSMEIGELAPYINKMLDLDRKIHYLPAYPYDRKIFLSALLNKSIDNVSQGNSVELIEAVISQRIHKSDAEVTEIEKALNEVTGPMHIAAMKLARPGQFEYQIVAEIMKIMKLHNCGPAYPVICTVHGETLHNESHTNKLQEGKLLLLDAGAESKDFYASDITRTTPVGGRFNSIQKEIYELVLQTQIHAIEAVGPGTRYADVHMKAAREITEGLKQLGIMKGDIDEATSEGAHALFFPHGLGHMLGLDVHDMEDLGETRVGYSASVTRSSQFGKASLRLARELEPGFVLTVEPGIYFIPALIELWKKDKKFEDFINYDRVEQYMDFGGIRIEDNVLVTTTGNKTLGNPIPKTIRDVESVYQDQ